MSGGQIATSTGTGAATGAAAGAAVGSVLPGPGTAIGAVVGGVVGGVGGYISGRGQSARDNAKRRAQAQAVEAENNHAGQAGALNRRTSLFGSEQHNIERGAQVDRLGALPQNEGRDLTSLADTYSSVGPARIGPSAYANGVNAVSQQRAEAALASQGLETSRGVLSGRNAGKDIEYENAFARRGSIIRAERERASVERARIEEEYARTSIAARRASLAANQAGSQQIMTGGILTSLAPAAASAVSSRYGSASTPAAASTTTNTGGWV